VRVVEFVLAGLFALGGIRSLVYWLRRPLVSESARDQVLYAAWMTGRAGLWFAVGGIFLISALIGYQGRAFTEEFNRYRWYLFVLLGLAILQLVAGLLLARRERPR
jgi:hypothetical protein